MKKIAALVLSVFFISNSYANSVTYTCLDIYAKAAANDQAREDNYNDAFNTNVPGMTIAGGPASWNSALTIFGFFGGALTGSLPIVLAATLTPSAINFIVNATDKEERALRLLDESQRSHKGFVRKLQKKISENITEEQVSELIAEGFASGAFCSDLPKLYSARKIKKHVKAILEAQYQ